MPLANAAIALAALAAAAAAPLDPLGEPPVRTGHEITIAGKPFAYVAETGRIALRDVETGEPHGYMFYIAYRAAAPSAKPRPVTFVWNGGPGANSATLHFDVVGPKLAQGGKLIDNPDTWLSDTDLVFVDPIGTGFSRPAKASYADEFYGTVGDVASITEFIRSWRLLHDAEAAPLFVAGESWGAGRAASVAYQLEKRRIRVNGMLLISGGAGLTKEIVPDSLRTALHVVDLVATAMSHGLVPREEGTDLAVVQAKAETWAREVYAPALERVATLRDSDRTAIRARLSAFTGMPADQIDPKTLTFSPRQYLTTLRKPQTLNAYDMRKTDSPRDGAGLAILKYLRGDLGYRTDLPYVGLERMDDAYAPTGTYPVSVGSRWDYATAKVSDAERLAAMQAAQTSGAGPPRIGPPLPGSLETVALDANAKVFVASGVFDSFAPCAGYAELARVLSVDVRGAYTFKCYPGGHMMYQDTETRLQFSRDVKAFIRSSQLAR